VTSRIIDDPTTLNELIHVHVFGGSVEPTTDYEISQAVESGRCDNLVCTPTVLQYDYGWNGTHYVINVLNDNFGHRLYDRREGKPYQADIEAHVAAFRGHIPYYVGDGAWLAKGIAKTLVEGHDVHFRRIRNEGIAAWVHMPTRLGETTHNDLAIAFWNAAIRACGYND
jgi:hypothetical protein